MLRHLEVVVITVNAYSLGIHVTNDNSTGIVASLMGIGCFTILYLYDCIKNKNKGGIY